MTATPDKQFTDVLRRVSADSDSVFRELLPLVMEELRAMAAAHLRHERPHHTLQPTALVHEAFLKLVDQSQANFADRRHFMAIASRAMRQVLVDSARRHRAAKRGGGALRVTLDQALLTAAPQELDISALDDALAALEKFDERKGRVVELRFFGGMTNAEAAEVLGVSPKTTEADWYIARAWLRRALSEGTAP